MLVGFFCFVLYKQNKAEQNTRTDKPNRTEQNSTRENTTAQNGRKQIIPILVPIFKSTYPSKSQSPSSSPIPSPPPLPSPSQPQSLTNPAPPGPPSLLVIGEGKFLSLSAEESFSPVPSAQVHLGPIFSSAPTETQDQCPGGGGVRTHPPPLSDALPSPLPTPLLVPNSIACVQVVKTVINEGSQVLASSQVQTAIATVQSHPKDIVIIGAVLVVAAVLWVSRRTIFWKLAQRRGYPEDVDTVINKYCVEVSCAILSSPCPQPRLV